jgi:zinc protease
VSVSAHALKKDVPLVIQLIAEQLRTPAFSAEEFAKAKKQLVAGIQRSLESTDSRADDAYNRSIYPQGHLNRSLSNEEMLAAIEAATVEEIKTFHQAYYGTAAMKLVMTGDVDIPAAQAALAQAFAGWTNGKAMPETTAAQFAPLAKPAVLDVKMDGKTSVSVIWGQPTGLRYRDPDYHALRIATAILGSGFTGRLMATVRDQEGLTYSIGAGLQNDSFHDGDWHIGASFAPELLEKGIASTQIQLQKWLKNGVTEAEVRDRKTNLIGAFKVGLATTGSMAGALLSVLNRGYDPSWLDELPTRLEAITTPQVNAAIRKYLKPDNMVLVKAGSFQ